MAATATTHFQCYLCGFGCNWPLLPSPEEELSIPRIYVQLGVDDGHVQYEPSVPAFLLLSNRPPGGNDPIDYLTAEVNYSPERHAFSHVSHWISVPEENPSGSWHAGSLDKWVTAFCSACAVIAAPYDRDTPLERLPNRLFRQILKRQGLVPYQARLPEIEITGKALAHLPPLRLTALVAYIRQHLHRMLGLVYPDLRINDSVTLNDLPARLITRPCRDDPLLSPSLPGLLPRDDGGHRLILPLDVTIEYQLPKAMISLLRRGAPVSQVQMCKIMCNPKLRERVWQNIGLFEEPVLLGFIYYADRLPDGVALMQACQKEVPDWYLQRIPRDTLLTLAAHCDKRTGASFATERLRVFNFA